MNYSNLTKQFRTMLENAVPTTQVLTDNQRDFVTFQGNDSNSWLIVEGYPTIEITPDESLGPSFSLADEGLKAYNEFLEELGTDQTIEQKVGSGTLEKSLEKLLRAYNGREGTSDSEIADLIKNEIQEIKASIKEWTAIAPIDFLIFRDISELSVGKVTFKKDADVIEDLRTNLYKSIDANESSPEEKSELKTVLNDQISEIFTPDSVVANVQVEGESTKVKYLGEEEIEMSLNLLRCFTHVLFSPGLRVKMGLRHETGYYMRPSIGFSATDESWIFGFDNVGVNHNYELIADKIAFLKQHFAFEELSQILAKPNHQRTKLEKLIVTVVRWLGRGVSEDDKANKMLHFAAASETLIMGQISEQEITEKFSRRLAFLICTDKEQRKKVFAQAKTLYNKRSKIIHAGSTSIDESDVISLEFLTLRALVAMARRTSEWKSHEDFTNWYNSVSFS